MFWKFKKRDIEEQIIAIVYTCGGYAVRRKNYFGKYEYMDAAKNIGHWWSEENKAEFSIFNDAGEAKEKYLSSLDVVVEYING